MRRKSLSASLSLSMVRCAILSEASRCASALFSVSILPCYTSDGMQHDCACAGDRSLKDHLCQPFRSLTVMSAHAARCGCQVRVGILQSMPSSSMDNWAGVNHTAPLSDCGQTKLPFASRLANRYRPSPSYHSSLMMSPRRRRNANTWPANGFWVRAHCARAARPSKPLRISVCPAASHTLVPAGKPIIEAPPGSARC